MHIITAHRGRQPVRVVTRVMAYSDVTSPHVNREDVHVEANHGFVSEGYFGM